MYTSRLAALQWEVPDHVWVCSIQTCPRVPRGALVVALGYLEGLPLEGKDLEKVAASGPGRWRAPDAASGKGWTLECCCVRGYLAALLAQSSQPATVGLRKAVGVTWCHQAASYRRMCSGGWPLGPVGAVADTADGQVCLAQVRLWKLAVGLGWVHGATWCSS